MTALEQQARPSVGTRPGEDACGTYSLDALDDKARVLGGAFVVVVEVSGEPVRSRRRPYLTAAAAERAARAAQSRGQNARVYLAELTPLYRVRGWEA